MISRFFLAAVLATTPLYAEGDSGKSGAAGGSLKTPANPLAGKMLAGFGVSATKKGIRVRHVYKNSPAEKAGIRPGDLIEKIDGKPTFGLSTEDFVRQLMTADPHELVVHSGAGEGRTVTLAKADGATFSGGMLQASISAFLDVKVGDEAPDFEAVTASGEKVLLSGLRGRPVLINFTATWCQPCREQAPELVQAYARLRESGMEFLSVYLDSADTDVRAYAEKLGVTWPVRNDEKSWQGDTAQAYGVTVVPTNILVGKDGKIVSTDFRVPHL